MNRSKLFVSAVAAVVLACGAAHAALVENYNFSVGALVPDNNASGMINAQTISSAITDIGSMTVTLNISSGFNGDLFVYLSHGDNTSFLLNRVGRSGSSGTGYGDNGFQVTFADSAANDIHNYRDFVTPLAGTPLTGTWHVDGRNADPTTVLDTSPRASGNFLSAFDHADANGTWTLFLADRASGSVSQIDSWGLQITAVPEPVNVALGIFCGLFGAGVAVRRWRFLARAVGRLFGTSRSPRC